MARNDDHPKMFALSLAATAMMSVAGAAGARAAGVDHDRNQRIDFLDLQDALERGFDKPGSPDLDGLLEVLGKWGDLAPTDEFAPGLRYDQVIDRGDGTFQIALDPAVGTAMAPWMNGLIEWEYAGQAIYKLADGAALERVEDVPFDDDPPADTLTRLLKTEMEDEHGRLFRARSVDEVGLAAAIAAYEARVEHDFGVREDPGEEDAAALDAEVRAKSRPLTWFRFDQNSDGDLDYFRWDADDRTRVAEPMSERQEKVVQYVTATGLCSGVLVDDRFVLTAAHCAKDDAGDWQYPRGTVCIRAGAYSGTDCANVTARWGNGAWGGEGDQGDDIIVMKIDEDLGRDNYMPLSAASNATLKDHNAYNIGYPGWNPDGTFNSISRMYWAKDIVNHTSTKVIGTKIDLSGGHSGGPIFYYPHGVADGRHYLTGIVSGHAQTPTKSWNGGAKIPYHRDWIIGVMDAHR